MKKTNYFNVNWIVDRYHVLTSIEEIEKNLLKRMEGISPTIQKEVIKHARKRHAQNFKLYSRVMGGSL